MESGKLEQTQVEQSVEIENEENVHQEEKEEEDKNNKKKGRQFEPELIEEYKKLIEYKNNLFKLEALTALEQNEAEREVLIKLRDELVQIIQFQESAIKSRQKSDEFVLSADRLTGEEIDRVCRCYYETSGKWHNATIHSVDVDNQEADVAFIGFKDIVKVNAIFIKLLPVPNPILFEPGTYCDAIYSRDGHFYSCVIEKVSEAGYHVKFKKYNNREVVPLNYLRESKSADNPNKKKLFEDTAEFKIPENLKILPNDSEAQRAAKKKKLKALKSSFKQSILEKDSREKQNKWMQFQNKGSQSKEGYFHGKKNTESMFKSPDTIEGRVGVIGSGKGMTNFNPKLKINGNDNSYLSRLF